jgi:Gpi18-like mannosyltransferase
MAGNEFNGRRMNQAEGSEASARVFYPLCAGLILVALVLRWLALPFQSRDMQDFLLQWFDYIVTHGRLAALSDNFYNYTPPYIYMMTAVSYLDPIFSRVTLIKSISMLFDFISAFLVYKIVLLIRQDRRLAIFSACLFLNLPTLILNGAVWGQCDIIYTTFLLAFAYYLIRGFPFQAMLVYAIALSLKVQAIFLAPFFVYLLMSGAIPWRAVMLPPITYGLLVLPAALAGRSWISLIGVYAGQVGFTHSLSAHAPNIYALFQAYLSSEGRLLFSYAALVMAALASVLLLASHFRLKPPLPPLFILVTVMLWLGLEPSLLPRMHERYFFPADMFAFLFACLVPRCWWIAALFQAGSTLGYIGYLTQYVEHPPVLVAYSVHIGTMAMIAAMVGVVRLYLPYVYSDAPAGLSLKAIA